MNEIDVDAFNYAIGSQSCNLEFKSLCHHHFIISYQRQFFNCFIYLLTIHFFKYLCCFPTHSSHPDKLFNCACNIRPCLFTFFKLKKVKAEVKVSWCFSIQTLQICSIDELVWLTHKPVSNLFQTLKKF